MSFGLFILICALIAAVVVLVRLASSVARHRREIDELIGANTRLRREYEDLQHEVAELRAAAEEPASAPLPQRATA